MQIHGDGPDTHLGPALEIFVEDYPEATAILLYRGEEKIKKGNVYCLPCEPWLSALKPDVPLAELL